MDSLNLFVQKRMNMANMMQRLIFKKKNFSQIFKKQINSNSIVGSIIYGIMNDQINGLYKAL